DRVAAGLERGGETVIRRLRLGLVIGHRGDDVPHFAGDGIEALFRHLLAMRCGAQHDTEGLGETFRLGQLLVMRHGFASSRIRAIAHSVGPADEPELGWSRAISALATPGSFSATSRMELYSSTDRP